MRLLRRLMPGTEPIECIGHFRVLPQDQEFACWREESGDCGVESERLSTLVRWNTPIVRAYYLKEAFQLFWDYQQPKRAGRHLEKWMRSAMRSRLEPFKRFVGMLRGHLDGNSGLDQPPCLQRCRRRHEQQDQVHQPSFIRVPHCRELHCSDRSLLRPAIPTSRTLITLLGQEPEFVHVLSLRIGE